MGFRNEVSHGQGRLDRERGVPEPEADLLIHVRRNVACYRGVVSGKAKTEVLEVGELPLAVPFLGSKRLQIRKFGIEVGTEREGDRVLDLIQENGG
jgi:hypothetical protein